MSDERGQQNSHDTGSPKPRPRDDLRTATKKSKPDEKRDEARDNKDNLDRADKNKSE